MPMTAVGDNSRVALRIRPDDKTLIMRAVALRNTDMTDFILSSALRAAREVISEAEQLQLSERDSLRVLALLEHPPEPNARLQAAAEALPSQT